MTKTTHLIITGNLTARTAVHVGSGNSSGLTDALIRRDGTGNPLIPGTAIAGALRSLLTRFAPNIETNEKTLCNSLLSPKEKKDAEKNEAKIKKPCGCVVCQLMGDITPTDEGDDTIAKASRLYVYNAELMNNKPTIIRDGVGINRTTRTAMDAAKFDLEVLPAGTTFNLHLEVRCYHDDEPIKEIDRQLLAIALFEWQAGRAWLGGRVARGLGGFTLDGLEITDGSLHDSTQLMGYLRGEAWGTKQDTTDWLSKQLKNLNIIKPKGWKQNSPITRRWIKAEFVLKGTGPLVANDTASAVISGFDHAPMMLGFNNWGKPVLTGSSLRGVIRSHAEKIARTLATIEASNKTEFLKSCPACNPLVARKPDDKGNVTLESCDSLLKYTSDKKIKHYIRLHDDVKDEHLCLACHLFGSTRRGSRLYVEDAQFHGDDIKYKMLDFLAIDRFTGGGADGAKFDALTLWQPKFKVQLYLENPQDWELGWLALTLRDMACGWLNVGMGAAKGLGQVKIQRTDWLIQLGFLERDELGFIINNQKQKSGIYQVAECRPDNQGDWLNKAQKWVKEFNKRCRNNVDETETKIERPIQADCQDSYFGKAVEKLYPINSTIGVSS